jgi:tRNA A37 threonylcarbamoyladenosine dehydratase
MMREPVGRIPAVKVIGLGGIGASVARAMAQFLAHEGAAETLWLIDGDGYEERNRARVRFAEAGNKASSWRGS